MVDAPAPIEIAEPVIVVTGRGLEGDDRLSASRTIDRAAIERSSSGRMEDVLRDIAGLASFRRSDSRSAHPTSQGLTLRGLGGNAASRVTVSLDGVPQADPFGGWIAFTALDPYSVDRIRVVRGGGAGLGNVAGTIDLDSRAPAATVDARASAGSRSAFDARLLAGTRWDAGFASVSGSFSRGDGFVPVVDADRGLADQRAPFTQGSLRTRLVQAIGADTEAQLSLSTYRDRRTRGTDFTLNRQRGSDASLRLVGSGATRWSALAFVQDRNFASQFAAIGAGRASASETLAQRVPSRGWGARGELARSFGPVELHGGAEWRRVAGATDEDFRFVAGAPTRRRAAGGRSITAGLFGGARWSAGGWSAEIETRFDRWRIEDGRLVETDRARAVLTDRRFDDRSGWEASGRVAAGRELGDGVGLRVAAYRGWRLPTLNELYRPFRAGADATAANAALDPERVRGVEAGVDWVPFRGAKLSGTVFANRLKGAIANVTLGSGPGIFPGVGFVAGDYRMRRNVDALAAHGAEIDASVTRGAWRGALSYALTDARIRASGTAAALDGRRPAQVARHSGSASIGWADARIGLDATARLTGRQFEDDNNIRDLPAALTFDAGASYALTRTAAIELRVENLTDRRVLAARASDGTRESALPRTLWIGLRLR